MATVWAYRVGAWTRDPSTGWSHTLEMRGLGDLMSSMDGGRLQGIVTHLAIVAHGNEPGVVQLDRTLDSTNTASTFAAELNRLRRYLTRDGMLTFFSCIAGQGEQGSELLVGLAKQLPGRTIVGFELFGLIGPSGIPNAPGNMVATEASNPQVAMDPRSQHGRLSPWCPFAKRARDGKIVHIPILEQNGRPNRTCANPRCGGHDRAGQSCAGW